jgi:hypothetical protein
MKLKEYKALRRLLYEACGVLGTHAEKGGSTMAHRYLSQAYVAEQITLDLIDELGVRLKYLSPRTMDYPKKRKAK